MIASSIQWIGLTKPPAGSEKQAAPVAQTAPTTVAPKEPTAPSLDWEQMQQMARDLAALRQNVDQLIASQNQMARQMATLQSDLVDVLLKMPEPQRRERQ
jgi:hypothetical protein